MCSLNKFRFRFNPNNELDRNRKGLRGGVGASSALRRDGVGTFSITPTVPAHLHVFPAWVCDVFCGACVCSCECGEGGGNRLCWFFSRALGIRQTACHATRRGESKTSTRLPCNPICSPPRLRLLLRRRETAPQELRVRPRKNKPLRSKRNPTARASCPVYVSHRDEQQALPITCDLV